MNSPLQPEFLTWLTASTRKPLGWYTKGGTAQYYIVGLFKLLKVLWSGIAFDKIRIFINFVLNFGSEKTRIKIYIQYLI